MNACKSGKEISPAGIRRQKEKALKWKTGKTHVFGLMGHHPWKEADTVDVGCQVCFLSVSESEATDCSPDSKRS